ncbi:MAG: c-type cytochrome [Gammaproteobacteria bacterium]|nr:c-type cytochrome [Gammaproteobacteria bacterium]
MKKTIAIAATMLAAQVCAAPLGLPEVPIPAANPQTEEKVALGQRLFNDTRFSSTGTVSCATCHASGTAFTDSPKHVSEGINQLTGTRNAPTVVNAAFNQTQFWDGRSPDLEDQALHPFLNPVEMGLPDHGPILATIRDDRGYTRAFKRVFNIDTSDITIKHVTQAIAAFERTIVSGDSPFDRWYYGHDDNAIGDAAKRGFEVFLKEGRCVSCHSMEQDFALFTDHKFHNIGIGINDIQGKVTGLARAFLVAKANGADVDVAVLTDADTSHLGRFAVTDDLSKMGAFKTPTLRNIAVTAPYMHDGSLDTLEEVVNHYNNGGITDPQSGNPNDFLSGGIRPLNLTEQQITDLVAFMETLTSPTYANGGNR